MIKTPNNSVKTLSRIFIDSQKNLPKSRLCVSMLILCMDFTILIGALSRQGFNSTASFLTNAKQGIVMVSFVFAWICPILVIFFSIYSLLELRIYAQIIYLYGAEKWMIKGICVHLIFYLLKPGVFISIVFAAAAILWGVVFQLTSLWLYSLVFVSEIVFMLFGGTIFLYCFIAYILYSLSHSKFKHKIV
ncbi:MAG: hypothetical protein PUA63_04715 [Oscillospiraceae bacterium]|nr:hypothetical protein [Oscillospiraceae bacterium]